MVDLRPWRMPAGIALLVSLVIPLVAAVAVVVRNAGVSEGSLLNGLASAGFGSTQVATAVVLAALCWWATSDGVRGVRPLAVVALVVVAVQLLLTVAAAVATYQLFGDTQELRLLAVLVQLSWLVLPGLAGAVLLRCALVPPAPERIALPAPVEVEPEPEQAPPTAVQAYGEAAGWAPDEAAGAAWTSAGEAARGATASGWGSGTEPGWAPADWSRPRELEPGTGAGPERSAEQVYGRPPESPR